jgi:hypothetical protein
MVALSSTTAIHGRFTPSLQQTIACIVRMTSCLSSCTVPRVHTGQCKGCACQTPTNLLVVLLAAAGEGAVASRLKELVVTSGGSWAFVPLRPSTSFAAWAGKQRTPQALKCACISYTYVRPVIHSRVCMSPFRPSCPTTTTPGVYCCQQSSTFP